MSSDDAYRKEVEKRLLDLEKVAKEIFEQIEMLKLLLTDSQSQRDPETVLAATPIKTEEETRPPNCLHYFGYLRFIPRNKSFPEECLTCQKAIACSKHVQ
jgi:hypothetical protein